MAWNKEYNLMFLEVENLEISAKAAVEGNINAKLSLILHDLGAMNSKLNELEERIPTKVEVAPNTKEEK